MPSTAKKTVIYSEWPNSHVGTFDDVMSRKVAFVPYYEDMVKFSARIAYWCKVLDAGTDVVVYDLDGPRHPDGTDNVLEVTETMLRDKINDRDMPFGHGYVVGALLKGITHLVYT